MIYEEWLENEDEASGEQNGETSTWIALADLMTGLMAIFLVMFLIMKVHILLVFVVQKEELL